MELYILEGKITRPAWDMEEWGKYMEHSADDPLYRHVARELYYVDKKEFCDLSTVFLGIDHNYGVAGVPILFESMIFGGGHLNELQKRYCTWDEAEKGHAVLDDVVHDAIYSKFDIGGVISKVEGKRTDTFFHTHVDFTPQSETELRLIREN